MGLLKPAMNTTAYMKVGILGFAGSGKTFTATCVARDLAIKIGAKQVAFFDTEKGSDFSLPVFRDAGIELLVHRGRAFKDLVSVMDECSKEKIQLLMIDSITHVWRDLCESYQKKQNRKFLTMQDWGVLKGQWKEYTDRYLNLPIHTFMLGRAGYTYEQDVGEDGKKEMIQSGVKMKVEGETGFEPDLLIEMERVEEKTRIVNRAFVLKDRSNTINGKVFDYPTLKNFEPFLKYLNIGGQHIGVDTTRNSEDIFDSPDRSYAERQKRTEIALEEIKEALILAELDGTSNDAKKGRTEILIKCFGTSAWTAISNLRLNDILDGVQKLRVALGQAKAAPATEADVPDWKSEVPVVPTPIKAG